MYKVKITRTTYTLLLYRIEVYESDPQEMKSKNAENNTLTYLGSELTFTKSGAKRWAKRFIRRVEQRRKAINENEVYYIVS